MVNLIPLAPYPALMKVILPIRDEFLFILPRD